MFNEPRQINYVFPKFDQLVGYLLKKIVATKYLGFIFSNNGSFNEHIISLKK